MKKTLLLTAAAAALAGGASAQVYLADTAFTTEAGAGGAKASCISKPNGNNYGFGMNKTTFFALADDFTVPTGQTWNVDTVILYGYQTGSSTTSPITSVNLEIRRNTVTGTSVYGDTSTNRLTASTFTNIYRVDTGAITSTQRPIMTMKVKVTPTLSLTAGTYWLIWSAAGNTSLTGPWGPPKVKPGRVNPTGQNGMQRTNGVWKAAKDSTSPTAMQAVGFNFIVKGPATTAVAQVAGLPETHLQVLPNPAQRAAQITFELSQPTTVGVKIYNMAGQAVATVATNEAMAAGQHSLALDAGALAAGAYFCELQTPEGKQTVKMTILK